ncbi:MAG: hypothetical protein PVH88_23105 [Ignavibacteria bacterium]|jgi:hypothetical protein
MDLVKITKDLLLYGSLLFGIVLLFSFILERIRQKRIKANKASKPKSNLIQRAKLTSNLSMYSKDQQYFIGSYDNATRNSKELKFYHNINQCNQFYYRNHFQNDEIIHARASINRQRYTIVNEIMKENSKNFKKIYLDNYSASA